MRNKETEIWEAVKGNRSYEISNLGRVKRLSRMAMGKNGDVNIVREKILKQNLGSNGYLTVNIDGYIRTIHTLLAESFLNHVRNGHTLVVDHQNNIKTDNRLENLQVVTQRENLTKDKKNKTSKFAGVSKSAKLWKSQIRINKKCLGLGRYETEEEAAKVYQLALKHKNLYTGDNKQFRNFIKQVA
tara:strand:+ start:1276 stop:1833 length:558 start_codon:yes stop_codon:yes gene_type:complete